MKSKRSLTKVNLPAKQELLLASTDIYMILTHFQKKIEKMYNQFFYTLNNRVIALGNMCKNRLLPVKLEHFPFTEIHFVQQEPTSPILFWHAITQRKFVCKDLPH